MLFRDRREAGERLADHVHLAAGEEAVVFALPRGGVPVAHALARRLRLPLDVLVVRKLGVPGREELAMGAIANGSVTVLNEGVIEGLSIAPGTVDAALRAERAELDRRVRLYRGECPGAQLAGRTAILVDDGIATGADMRAAVASLAKAAPRRIVVAAPVASWQAVEALDKVVDEVVCLHVPDVFRGVGWFYRDFRQTTDAEVMDLLADAGAHGPLAAVEGTA